jgi:FkbM family methyltransferase
MIWNIFGPITSETVKVNTFWVQIDISPEGVPTRFFMDDCGGRDQVVVAVNQGGWRNYEAPLPEIIAKLCRGLNPIFVDVGANTGYYSLLAIASGASKVFAFEPVPSIHEIFTKNIKESAMTRQITLFELGIGEANGSFTLYLPESGHGLVETSASLNKDFRSSHSDEYKVEVITLDYFGDKHHSELVEQQVVMKIDVETFEPQVILGGLNFIHTHRPVIAIEILPGSDIVFFENFCREQNYEHIWLRPGQPIELAHGSIEASIVHRDHLLVPAEKTGSL